MNNDTENKPPGDEEYKGFKVKTISSNPSEVLQEQTQIRKRIDEIISLKKKMIDQNKNAIEFLVEFDDMKSEGLTDDLRVKASISGKSDDSVTITQDWVDDLIVWEKHVIGELYKVAQSAYKLRIALESIDYNVDDYGNRLVDGHRLGYEGGETGWRTIMRRNAITLKRLQRKVQWVPTKKEVDQWDKVYTSLGGKRKIPFSKTRRKTRRKKYKKRNKTRKKIYKKTRRKIRRKKKETKKRKQKKRKN